MSIFESVRFEIVFKQVNVKIFFETPLFHTSLRLYCDARLICCSSSYKQIFEKKMILKVGNFFEVCVFLVVG